MRRNLSIFMVIGLIIIIAGQVYAGNTMKIGYWVEEPQIIANPSLTEDSHPKGIVVDYLEKYIAPAMGISISWIGPLTLDRLQKSLEEGSIDAMAMLSKNPERAEKFVYPSDFFCESQPALAVLKSNPLNKIEKISDINNLKIGYSAGARFSPFMSDPSIKFDLVATPDHLNINMQKMLAGRIDAVYSMQIVTLKYDFAKHSDISKFKFLPLPEKPVPLYTVFSKKADPGFVKSYEAANEKSKGNYKNVLKQYVSE